MHWGARRVTICLLLSSIFCFIAAAADSPPKLRLGEVQQVKPGSYRLDLTLDPNKDTFSGSIQIRLRVDQPLQTLWLNATDIRVQKASLTKGGPAQNAVVISG